MVLFAATFVPIIVIIAVAETGAKLELPIWVAVTEQSPACNRLSTDPEIVHELIGVLVYVI